MKRLRWLFALPALLLVTTGPSDAADIRDKGSLFSTEAVQKAEAELKRIEKEYSVPVQIETIESLEGRSIDAVLPEHAKAADAKGLFILMSKKDHKIEVGASKSYTKYLTRAREVAIREAFTREFKAGDYDGGLAKGVEKIDSTLSEARAEAGGSLRPKTAATPAPHRGGQAQPPIVHEVPGKPSSLGGMSMWLTIGLGLLALFIVIKVLGAIFGGGNRGYAGNQRMMGPGQGGMGGPGYGPGYGGGGGGGGFMSSMFGGIGGALAGNWLYDQFSGRHHDSSVGQSTSYDPGVGTPDAPANDDFVTPGDGGGDWGGGGGDTGGGGDWGGGGGGGDWGGGGGGDWGGGGGGDDGGSW
jgi:uncharacterized membrane protein YgcG